MDLGPGMVAKLTALTAQVKTVLDSHGLGTFRVDDHLLLDAIKASGNDERREIMGNPARYARVEYEGEADPVVYNINGGYGITPHRFGIMVWFGLDYRSEGRWAASIRSAYRLFENRKGQPGLLPYFRNAENECFTVDGDAVYVYRPEQVAPFILNMDESQGEYVYYLEFSIVIA